MADVSNPFAKVAKRLLGTTELPAHEARRAREKILSPTDGRTLRSKGKSVVVNYRVTPDFKKDLYQMAKAEGRTMTEILERALEAYKHTRVRPK